MAMPAPVFPFSHEELRLVRHGRPIQLMSDVSPHIVIILIYETNHQFVDIMTSDFSSFHSPI